jgi:hypothetical protein
MGTLFYSQSKGSNLSVVIVQCKNKRGKMLNKFREFQLEECVMEWN